MRKFCIILIAILIFNLAYCQSKIIGNGHSDNMSVPSDNRSEPTLQTGNDYLNNMSESAYSQLKSDFQPGVIITKDGDTLGGLIKYEYPVPADKVIYKPDWIGTDSIFSIHQVKSIITRFVYFENIPFKGKESMMPLLAVGKINLYGNTKNDGEIIYVLEKDRNQFIYINYKDFKGMMRHIFFDTPDMLKKIGKEGYTFDDMIKIVRYYNKRFQ